MYREKIREYYNHLSRSYRRVADYVLSSYYEVAFMTAAQLASQVEVDTTTVVRFSQRLGYEGYPELLNDIRQQVKAEIYHVYEPQEVPKDSPVALFQDQVKQEIDNLRQLLVHNPPARINGAAAMMVRAQRIFLVAEGYASAVTSVAAQHLRYQGAAAECVEGDPIEQAVALVHLDASDLMVGISLTEYGETVARAIDYARSRGCRTLGMVGSLAHPLNRISDQVIYAPTDGSEPLPNLVAPMAALTALARVLDLGDTGAVEQRQVDFRSTYHFLVQSGQDGSTAEEPAPS